ncbi:hypothetical protein QSI_3618 [Clostridioides difficile P28]|nr:hypothetical protein QSI_3618 [Clostridioides difficile P28]
MCFPYGKQQRSDLQVSPCDMLYSRCRSNDILSCRGYLERQYAFMK